LLSPLSTIPRRREDLPLIYWPFYCLIGPSEGRILFLRAFPASFRQNLPNSPPPILSYFFSSRQSSYCLVLPTGVRRWVVCPSPLFPLLVGFLLLDCLFSPRAWSWRSVQLTFRRPDPYSTPGSVSFLFEMRFLSLQSPSNFCFFEVSFFVELIAEDRAPPLWTCPLSVLQCSC